MGKDAFKRDKTHLNIETISKELTKKNVGTAEDFTQIDGAPEELKQRITIKASHIEHQTDKQHYAPADCLKNMITGAAQMDPAILVIAITDGSMPPTYNPCAPCLLSLMGSIG